MTDRAAPSLELARDLRRAIKRRSETLAPAVEAYDFATDQNSRWAASTALMETVEATDRRFADDKAAAVAKFEQAEAGSV